MNLDDIRALKDKALAQFRQAATAGELEQLRIVYLGAKGKVKDVFTWLKDVPREAKREFGAMANELKNALQEAFDAKAATMAAPRKHGPVVDVTLPGVAPRVGHEHLLTQTVNEICEIFARMGYTVAQGPEVEDERHNFEALNIPPSHPARDVLDNFYINDDVMLRSQTSTVQIRTMEHQRPPVRIIAPGRVYRPDTVDATHFYMFHQVEGLYVDEGVTMADLKTTIDQFVRAYFGPEIQSRFRPSFFPFTEPSAEIDILFHNADGTTRWIELGGCGMVDPNVLEAVGYDSERYTGFAFGMGIERMVMRKHGLTDIRQLFEGDVRFLHQF
ncbi:MAG: phenylalanine--tRNA ligase subunit alpha [Phycisphaerae bacterium]|nr:phenylalanine--tRNA ligase subunit alpha [Phycisphaerae bacterium]